MLVSRCGHHLIQLETNFHCQAYYKDECSKQGLLLNTVQGSQDNTESMQRVSTTSISCCAHYMFDTCPTHSLRLPIALAIHYSMSTHIQHLMKKIKRGSHVDRSIFQIRNNSSICKFSFCPIHGSVSRRHEAITRLCLYRVH